MEKKPKNKQTDDIVRPEDVCVVHTKWYLHEDTLIIAVITKNCLIYLTKKTKL